MRDPGRRRQYGLFLAGILAPAVVLVWLGIRVVRQENELARSRAAQERTHATDQAAREVTARLEAIKLSEINQLIRSGARIVPPVNPATILVAELNGDRLILPWEAARSGQPGPTPGFDAGKRAGELSEFGRKQFGDAVDAYREALRSARQPWELAEGRLLLARAEAKAGRGADAARTYHALLQDDSAATDEDGVPYWLYAAERLLASSSDSAAVYGRIIAHLASSHLRSPSELYLLQSLLGSALGAQAGAARAAVASLMKRGELVAALASDIPRVRSRVETPSSWMAYGQEPWLVTVTPRAVPLPALLVVVSAPQLALPGARLVSPRTEASDALGDALSGLAVEWEPGRFASRQAAAATPLVYGIGLALVLGLTTLGAYLLLRDVNRDMRVAEMRSQFVASVSHELKTPLTAIRMFAETLSLGRSKDPHMQAEYLETIVNECERLARLVDNVLDFSKIEQGKKIYRMRPTDLAGVVRSAARTMQYPLSQQGFALQVCIADDLPPVAADADAMEQAILNLLTNAMKYSGDAREIDLRLARQNGGASIEVQDRGVGIAAEEQSRIFEKYYRVRSADLALVAGTGLGLTLVSHIVSAHGGTVELRSAPNEGSTFSILIPVEAETVEAQA